jgi:hypothetical protein
MIDCEVSADVPDLTERDRVDLRAEFDRQLDVGLRYRTLRVRTVVPPASLRQHRCEE